MVKILLLRAASGLLPVIIAFVLPVITDVEFSSLYFQKFAHCIILSSVLKLGLDQSILKLTASYSELKNLLLLVLFSHLLVFLFSLMGVFDLEIVSLGSLFVSLNSIVSAFYLTNDSKFKAIVYQFILPNALIVVLSALRLDPILIVSLSYGSILATLPKKELVNGSVKITYEVLIKQLKGNSSLIVYNVLGVLLMNVPIAVSHNYISDEDVVSLNKMLKIFSLSSFIAMIIIFTFNNQLRKQKTTVNYFRYLRRYIPIVIPLLLLIKGLSFYDILPYSIGTIYSLIISLIIYGVIAGNIAGHYIILKSLDKSLLKIMLVTLSITFIALLFIPEINVISIVSLYVMTLFLEAVLKIRYVWNLR